METNPQVSAMITLTFWPVRWLVHETKKQCKNLCDVIEETKAIQNRHHWKGLEGKGRDGKLFHKG